MISLSNFDDKKKWSRGIFTCDGRVNGEKISKSHGNFLILD
jgi:hypothetical protein